MSDSSSRASLRHLRIRLGAANEDDLARSFKANLSPKGMYIKLSKELMVKEPIAIEVTYADRERVLYGEGSVSYIGQADADGNRGVSFDLEWDDESLARVKDILGRPSLMPDGGSTKRPSEQPLSVESLAPPPPSSPPEYEDTERAPTVRTQPFSESTTVPDSVPPLMSDESGTGSDITERIDRSEPPPAAESSDDDTDETVESPAPDFEAIRASQPPAAAAPGEADASGESAPTREPSKVWGWFRKRFGSTTKGEPSDE